MQQFFIVIKLHAGLEQKTIAQYIYRAKNALLLGKTSKTETIPFKNNNRLHSNLIELFASK
jgi:hypothetical protein